MGCLLAATIHGRTHERYGLGQPLEHAFADQKMSDIQLNDLGQRGNGLRTGIIEAVSGMDFET